MNIRFNDEYAKLVHPLSEQEYSALKSSINESNGNIIAIIVNQENVILDGHHRYRACNELNIEPKFEVKEFNSTSEEKKFVYEINLKRRHLNKFQKAELGYKLQEIESEKAKVRRLSVLRKGDKPPLVSNDANGKGKVAQIIADKIGIKRTDYERSIKIIERGAEQIKQRLRAGSSTIFKEYQRIIKEEITQNAKIEATKSALKLSFSKDKFELKSGPMQEKGPEIADNSIDLIFTTRKAFLFMASLQS